VITSTVRPIRRLTALVEQNQDGFVCSSGFAVIRPDSIEPELVLLYLRLPIVCEILDLYATASMYPAVSVSDIMNLPITMPDESLRAILTEMVQGCFAARREADRLFQDAIELVENMLSDGAVS
jgi:restriction endonuclease S subunit